MITFIRERTLERTFCMLSSSVQSLLPSSDWVPLTIPSCSEMKSIEFQSKIFKFTENNSTILLDCILDDWRIDSLDCIRLRSTHPESNILRFFDFKRIGIRMTKLGLKWENLFAWKTFYFTKSSIRFRLINRFYNSLLLFFASWGRPLL